MTPGRFRFVTVLTTDGGEPRTLYRGGLAAAQTALPAAWAVDNSGDAERFLVVFSRAEPEGARVRAALAAGERSEDLWVEAIVLPKAVAPRGRWPCSSSSSPRPPPPRRGGWP